MKRTFLALILCLTLLAASIPLGVTSATAATAALNEQQIEYTGGWNPPAYPVDGTLYKDRVAVSKTVSPTEVENYFDIVLKIVAKPRIIDQPVDVVVVMDISNTMNATHENLGVNSPGYDIKDARITHAKNAINQFVDKFSTDTNISENRGFGLVTFNSYANTVIPLTTLNNASAAAAIKSTVNSITAPTEDRVRFTNIEGGLQLAHNLLKGSEAVYKYIIFVTDGFPTTYIESGRESTTQIVGYDTYETGSYNASLLNTAGYFADAVTQKVCTYGVNYSDVAADKADDVAQSIQNDNINIFSIGIDVGVQSIGDYLKNNQNTSFTTVDRRSTNHVIGNTADSYKAWLRDNIAGGPLIDEASKTEEIHRYAAGNSSTQLETAFTNILKDIELIPAETMQEAFTIDPMSDYVEFLNFYDKEGNSVDAIYNTRTGAEVATFDSTDKSITWWLTNTQNFYIDDIGNYVLTMSYKVRLKNEMENFSFNTAFNTNDTTTFYFKTIDFSTGEPLYGDNHIDYLIPQVEGYSGDFVFTKQDSVTNHPLEGAEFMLYHDVDSCDICHAGGAAHEKRPVIEAMTATSNADGRVEFLGIPSGHEYVLDEIKAPDGYQPGTNHTVMVEYGKVHFHGKDISLENPAVITNNKIAPIEAVLSAKKIMEGREFAEKEFTFALDGVRMNGLEYHERHHINGEGMVVFDTITFDETGTFNFRIYELKGSDTSVIYDNTVYEVEFTVTLNDNGNEYLLNTKVNGKDVDNDTAPAPFEFTNTLRQPVSAQITATKTLDGETPLNGQFHFELCDENGEVLQEKSNIGKDVFFDEITYDKEGVYTYTIRETHECTSAEAHTHDSHIVFDHSVYTVKVIVTAPDTDAPFEAEVQYYLEGEITESANFANKTRQDTTLTLSAEKTLNGKAPEDKVFSFQLRTIDGKPIETARNTHDGKISFTPLTFSRPGYYIYNLYETIGNDNSVIYDETVYLIFVEVQAYHLSETYVLNVTVTRPDENPDKSEMFIYFGSDIVINSDNIVFRNKTATIPTEPTTVPTEPTTAPTEPTTVPTEPTTVPTEPTTVPTEPTTVPTEPTTVPTEPTTVPTEPTTVPTEPTTVPTEPTTVPTEPTTVPTEPTTVPTEPTTVPTEPTTVPTEPTTVPTEPITAPTEPITAPTGATTSTSTEALPTSSTDTPSEKPDTPKTSDVTSPLIWAAVIFVLGTGACVAVKKKKSEE